LRVVAVGRGAIVLRSTNALAALYGGDPRPRRDHRGWLCARAHAVPTSWLRDAPFGRARVGCQEERWWRWQPKTVELSRTRCGRWDHLPDFSGERRRWAVQGGRRQGTPHPCLADPRSRFLRVRRESYWLFLATCRAGDLDQSPVCAASAWAMSSSWRSMDSSCLESARI
jgi:hypothetical protein